MPDGQSLIFSSERDSRSDLYRVWLTDRRVDRLTHHFVGRAIMPNVSPDGKIRRVRRANPAAPAVLGVPDPHPRSRDRQDARARQQRRRVLAELVAGRPADRERARWRRAVDDSDSQRRRRRPPGDRARSEDVGTTTPTGRRTASVIAFSVSPQHHEGEDWDLAIVPPTARTAPQTDDRPRQRPLARLEAVKGLLHRSRCCLALILNRRSIQSCDAEPGARRSSCHPRPRRLQQAQAVSAIDRAQAVHRTTTRPVDAYCGTLKVYENRATKQGRQIDLNIVVLPALRCRRAARSALLSRRRPRPGRREAREGRCATIFRRVQTDRDIVLVDQRGTGKSNPLNCDSDDDSLQSVMQSQRADCSIASKACQAKYDADLTPLHHADRDGRSRRRPRVPRLRARSTSTAARTARARRWSTCGSTAIASGRAILDGVAPTNMRLPLYFPRDAQRAFELLAKDCAERRAAATRRIRTCSNA